MIPPAFSKTFFIENRKQLIEKLNSNSVALLFSNSQMPRNGDQYFPYRQNSDFFYLTGINQEKSALLIKKGSNNEEYEEHLFILKSDPNLEMWEGHKLTFDEAKEISGIESVMLNDSFELELDKHLTLAPYVYFNLNENVRFTPEIQSKDEINCSAVKERYPKHKIGRLSTIMRDLRLVKKKEEIQAIQHACDITENAFRDILKIIKPGLNEFEIEGEITRAFKKSGTKHHAYEPIIASGKSACILHYIENTRKCNNGDLLLMDFGAEWNNYASDLSRTIPVNGVFTERQRACYQATLRVFKYVRGLMVPNTTIDKFHQEVCEMWKKEHIDLGLYTMKELQNCTDDQPIWKTFYPHGTSHFMGLDVHDPGEKSMKLKPGMVLSCEPGLYIPNEGIGIRIENDILITEDGNKDLMESIPIEIDEIEMCMQKN